MDPLSGLAVAGAIIQLVDFGKKFLSETVSKKGEIFRATQDGSIDDGFASIDRILGRDTETISVVTVKMQRPLRPNGSSATVTEDEKALIELREECKRISTEIIDRLNGLKNKSQHFKTQKVSKSIIDQRMNSFLQAFKSVWTEDKLSIMLQRYSAVKKSLGFSILVSIRQNMDLASFKQSKEFKSLDQSAKDIISALLEAPDGLKDVRDQMVAVAHILNQIETTAAGENGETENRIPNGVYQTSHPEGQKQELSSRGAEQTILDKGFRTIVDEKVLETFQYRSMTDRMEEVKTAHVRTFDWIFQESESESDEKARKSFANWLAHGSDIYWISGKAGTGKSTLMRYIYTNPQTKRLLLTWAEPLTLTTAAFFFWNSGTRLQGSQLGFLRSLLYELLSQHRELIVKILPKLWARSYIGHVQSSFLQGNQEVWSVPVLKQLYFNILGQDKIPLKVCLFLDGLDEYGGSHADIVELIQDISKSANVKLCLSSRTLAIFNDKFGSASKICLEDLTSQDIIQYAKDKLDENALLKQLTLKEPNMALELVNEIVAKGNGVFLWVMLVIKSLIAGLGSQDDISVLQRRLKLLPGNLGDLYTHLLYQNDAASQKKASELFQLLHAVNLVDDVISAAEDPEMLTIFGLTMAIDSDLDLAGWDDTMVLQRCEKMIARLTACCAGMLTVQKYHSLVGDKPIESRRIVEESPRRVQYLHRTFKEYLEQSDTWNKQLQLTATYSFNPHLKMLISYIVQFKFLPISTPYLIQTVPNILMHAHFADTGIEQPYVSLLDELDQTLALIWEGVTYEEGILDLWADGPMLVKATQYGCGTYVKYKLNPRNNPAARNQHLMLQYSGRPLLDLAVNPGISRCKIPLSPNTIEALLQSGAKPNYKYKNATPWEHAIRIQFEKHLSIPSDDHERQRECALQGVAVFKVFLQYGADRQASCQTEGDRVSALTVVDRVFMKYAPEETAELKKRLGGASSVNSKRHSKMGALLPWKK